MGLINNINLHELQILSRRDFDNNNEWDQHSVDLDLHAIAIHFINMNNLCNQNENIAISFDVPNYTLSPKQKVALTIITNHHKDLSLNKPLHMIIQGTTRTKKSKIKNHILLLA